MVLFVVVWYGVVYCGMVVLYGVVDCGMVWYVNPKSVTCVVLCCVYLSRNMRYPVFRDCSDIQKFKAGVEDGMDDTRHS